MRPAGLSLGESQDCGGIVDGTGGGRIPGLCRDCRAGFGRDSDGI